LPSSIAAAHWRLERLRTSKYIPWFPTEKQAAFILCPTDEALYGGAAGGGKSVALLTGALEWVDQPSYNALLIRKTFQALSLPDALIPLSHQWLRETDARWNDNEHSWLFPSGATLTFGYLDTAADKYRYAGAAFQFIGWDELTDFGEEDYRFVSFSRQRRKVTSQVPIRVRATSNPGGPGHDWVRARFIEPGSPGTPFFPSQLRDNPYLDHEQYERFLDKLDPITRQQLLHGDWSSRPSGGWFQKSTFPIVDDTPVITKAVRYWDLAASVPKRNTDPDYTAGGLLGLGSDGNVYVLDLLRFREGPSETEQIMKRAGWSDSNRNATIWLEQEPGASGVIAVDHLVRDVLIGQPVYVDKKTVGKQERARPLAAAAARGVIRLLRASWNAALLDELEGFPTGGHDDQVDALSGAFAKLVDPGLMVLAGNDAASFRGWDPSEINGWEGYSLD